MSLQELKDIYVYTVDRLTLLMDMTKQKEDSDELKKVFFETYQNKAIDYLTQIDVSYKEPNSTALFNANHKLKTETADTKSMHDYLKKWNIPIYIDIDPNPNSELQGEANVNIFTRYKKAFSDYLAALVNDVRQNSDNNSEMIPLLTTGIKELIKTSEAFQAATLKTPGSSD